MLFFNISGDNFRGRYKTVKIVLFRVKFRRCAEGAEKLSFHSNTIKLTSFYFMFCLLIKGKIFEIELNKNYDFLKMPHKESSQNLSWHAAGWRSVFQKYNVIRSPDQYPCLVLGLLYLEQEKKVWALAFLNYKSSINIANIQPRKRDCATRLLFLSFPHKLVLSFSHKIILPWTEEMFSRRTLCSG